MLFQRIEKIKYRGPQTSVFLLKVYCNFCILDGLVGLWLILGIPRINKPPRIKTPHPEAPQNPGKSLFKWKPFMKWSVVAGGTGGFINPSRLFGRVGFFNPRVGFFIPWGGRGVLIRSEGYIRTYKKIYKKIYEVLQFFVFWPARRHPYGSRPIRVPQESSNKEIKVQTFFFNTKCQE